jgi:hypothetical protein
MYKVICLLLYCILHLGLMWDGCAVDGMKLHGCNIWFMKLTYMGSTADIL